MGQSGGNSRNCPIDDSHCSQWAKKYLDLCLCATKDKVSFALGLISVISWGVAEIPQIITNYKMKSAEGLSILFLTTWIVGDLFNLFGCLLEPATLPTQYYMALLYTITTATLTAQAIYYRHVHPQLKSNRRVLEEAARVVERTKDHTHGADAEKSHPKQLNIARSLPIPLPSSSSTDSDLYFMSARSLSVSHTPTLGSFSASRTPDFENGWFSQPLLADVRPTQSAPPPKIKTMLCVVSLVTFFLGCDYKITERHNDMISRGLTKGIVLQVRRKLLEVTSVSAQTTLAGESSGLGSFFGWGMAVIYLGGRLPQIWLNTKRGTAEGLNPLMFLFALFGNITYVGSILVDSLDWSKIQPNLPWLVDAGGCVLLDIFIISQFIYFRYRSRS